MLRLPSALRVTGPVSPLCSRFRLALAPNAWQSCAWSPPRLASAHGRCQHSAASEKDEVQSFGRPVDVPSGAPPGTVAASSNWSDARIPLGKLIKLERQAARHMKKMIESWTDLHGPRYHALQVAGKISCVADITAGIATARAEDARKLALEASAASDLAASSGASLEVRRFAREKAAAASQQAQAVAETAQKAVAKAHEQRASWQALRADYQADTEANLSHQRVEDEYGLLLYKRANIHSPCLVCGTTVHSPDTCHFLFQDQPPRPNTLFRHRRAAFMSRLRFDKQFRETVAYLRSKVVQIPMGPNIETLRVLPVTKDHFSDAPASAVPILQAFDRKITFRSIMYAANVAIYKPRLSMLEGYYRTLDADGRPLLILWPHSAPSLLDSATMQEIRLIQEFAAAFNSGRRSRFSNSEPPGETVPVGVVLVSSRWHTSKTLWKDNCMRISVASKLTWSQGSAVGYLHIGTKGRRLGGPFAGWSRGSRLSARWLDVRKIGRHDLLDRRILIRLLRASLRSIEEPVTPVFRRDLLRHFPWASKELRKWRTELYRRSVVHYGAGSIQARLLEQDSKYALIKPTVRLKMKQLGEELEDLETGMEEKEAEEVPVGTDDKAQERRESDRRVLTKTSGLPDFDSIMALSNL